jgi:hypothetical protein
MARLTKAQQRVQKQELMNKAFEMRKMGATIRQIAATLDRSKSTVHKWIEEVCQELAKERGADAAMVLELDLARLETATRETMTRVVGDKGEAGNKAVDRLIKLVERRAKLLGLDKPTKIAQTDPEGNAAWSPFADLPNDQLMARMEQSQAFIRQKLSELTERK